MFSLRNYGFLAIGFGFFISGCKTKPKIYFDGFSRNEAGLYYKMVSIGDGDYKINVWDDVNFTCTFKKQNDSVFFSSSSEKIYFNPSDSLDKSMFLAHFRNLVKGDLGVPINPAVMNRGRFGPVGAWGTGA